MGWWSRLVGREEPPNRLGDENLLVISDVHLGEDILIDGPEHLSDYIRALNRGLAEFVAAHRAVVVDGRPWHLVINGDLFDFVKVSLRPEPQEAYERWGRLDLRGLDTKVIPNTAQAVVWKLERIVEVHRPLFKELALFLLDGNRITILEGNHDAEFYFPEVRQTLRDTLARIAEQQHAREKRDTPFDAASLAERVQFRIWFEALSGRYHIEHGHQYDEYCSFEYQLAPYDKEGADTLATPFSHRPMPYFAELLGDFSTHGMEDRGAFWRIIRHVLLLGPRVIWGATKAYFVTSFEMVRRSGKRRRAEVLDLQARHTRRLEGMAGEAPYGYRTLERLDRLRATPAEFSLVKMVRVSYLDRFLLGAATALAMLPAFFLSFMDAAAYLVLVLGLGSVGQWILARTRVTDLPETLRRAAAGIAEVTGVRYVVLGHSHHPELVNLRERYGVGRFGENAFYLNTGSWVTREILLGEKGKGMTYVEITSRGAALKRWVGEESQPALLASTDGDLHVTVPPEDGPKLLEPGNEEHAEAS